MGAGLVSLSMTTRFLASPLSVSWLTTQAVTQVRHPMQRLRSIFILYINRRPPLFSDDPFRFPTIRLKIL
jgi:hypothetical protein